MAYTRAPVSQHGLAVVNRGGEEASISLALLDENGDVKQCWYLGRYFRLV